ncbi:hypothetical protein L9G15_23125, partial [Shewanella sp. A3A]|nr:hypothetical protein [Shewanella ferrihydritica]
LAVSRSAVGDSDPLLELLRPTLKSGESVGTQSRVPFVMIPSSGATLGKLLRNSASGAWQVPGSFGVRIHT